MKRAQWFDAQVTLCADFYAVRILLSGQLLFNLDAQVLQ